MLLDACNEDFPGDVYGAKLTGKHIEAIATEDAPFFLSLARLDLSDNRCVTLRLGGEQKYTHHA